MSMGLLLLGLFCAFLMHPELPFTEEETWWCRRHSRRPRHDSGGSSA